MTDREKLLEKCHATYRFAEKQLRHLIETHPDYFPLYTVNGHWQHGGESWTNWCEGFLGGQLWLIYEQNHDPYFREKAEHYSRLIEHRKADRNVHDLGFLFWSTWKRWYDLTGDPAIDDVVVEAGHTLALRFKEKGQYLRSFVADESLFIDIMMNVGIVFWAAEETGSLELRSIADQHCLTTRRCLVRGDGSTAHEGIFDLDTGEFIRQTTHQGYRGDSCWVRGLAWSLYGFAVAYRFTGDARYLATSRANAECFLTHTPSDGITPYDYDAPDGERPIDTSGTAIGAAGLLKLAAVCDDGAEQRRYREAAAHLIASLCRPRYLACETPGWEGILREQIY
ncbi:MAG: glycoside hydrolase family 88 protein, partial [Anaerolineae bacterium]|nr:glycoside hydrolase family 88 protein [Anaerolineae bacterium]